MALCPLCLRGEISPFFCDDGIELGERQASFVMRWWHFSSGFHWARLVSVFLGEPHTCQDANYHDAGEEGNHC
jgi:hypothetical protein